MVEVLASSALLNSQSSLLLLGEGTSTLLDPEGRAFLSRRESGDAQGEKAE